MPPAYKLLFCAFSFLIEINLFWGQREREKNKGGRESEREKDQGGKGERRR